MFQTNVSNQEVAKEVGEDIHQIAAKDRALGTEILSKGMEKLIPRLYAEENFMEYSLEELAVHP